MEGSAEVQEEAAGRSHVSSTWNTLSEAIHVGLKFIHSLCFFNFHFIIFLVYFITDSITRLPFSSSLPRLHPTPTAPQALPMLLSVSVCYVSMHIFFG